jgi:hypothetical protein
MNAKGRVWFCLGLQTRPAGPQLPLREAANLRLTWAGMRPGFEEDEAILWDRDSTQGGECLLVHDRPSGSEPFRRFM